MLVSSSSSLSSGSAQPPTGVPPQTEAEGGRRRVYAAGSGRGWSGDVAKRLSAGGRGTCCRCCYHAQRRVKRARAHMACPHPRTAVPARTRTACGGAPGKRSTRRRGLRRARRRPAGAEANACGGAVARAGRALLAVFDVDGRRKDEDPGNLHATCVPMLSPSRFPLRTVLLKAVQKTHLCCRLWSHRLASSIAAEMAARQARRAWPCPPSHGMRLHPTLGQTASSAPCLPPVPAARRLWTWLESAV